jgi:hypothetical protein
MSNIDPRKQTPLKIEPLDYQHGSVDVSALIEAPGLGGDNVAIFPGTHEDLPPELDTATELHVNTTKVRSHADQTARDFQQGIKQRKQLVKALNRIDPPGNNPNHLADLKSEQAWGKLGEQALRSMNPTYKRK